jgi:cytidyltransferase-like protein
MPRTSFSTIVATPPSGRCAAASRNEGEEVQESEIGVVHGRFQILHFGHLAYILGAKARCSFLIVGIANPDPSIGPPPSDTHRAALQANPLTFYERMMMITEELVAQRIPREDFAIAPFPIDRPELIRYYAPGDATFFLTIFDPWGEEKKRRLEALGLTTVVLNDASDPKTFNSSTIRERIRQGTAWKELVPCTTAEFLKRHGIVERIAAMSAEK